MAAAGPNELSIHEPLGIGLNGVGAATIREAKRLVAVVKAHIGKMLFVIVRIVHEHGRKSYGFGIQGSARGLRVILAHQRDAIYP